MEAVTRDTPSSHRTADYCIARVAALSCNDAQSISQPTTTDIARKIVALERTVQSLAVETSQDLHDLVGTLDNHRDLRRAALALRRDIHNLRVSPKAHRSADDLMQRMPAAGATRVASSLAMLEQIASLQGQLDVAVEANMQATVLPRLGELLEDSVFSRTIALTRPTLLGRLMQKRQTGGLERNTARTVMNFLHRAAFKTSPLGVFTLCGFASTRGNQESRLWKRLDEQVEFRLERGIATRIANALGPAMLTEPDLVLFRNPTLKKSTTGNLNALVNSLTFVLEHFWSQQRYAQFRFHSDIVDLLGRPSRQLQSGLAQAADNATWPRRRSGAADDGKDARARPDPQGASIRRILGGPIVRAHGSVGIIHLRRSRPCPQGAY